VAIGQALGISEHTVRNHVRAILAKLAVANRTDAVTTALRRGLVDLPG
jgi:DNA-binding NarL/FixJ family response regulator